MPLLYSPYFLTRCYFVVMSWQQHRNRTASAVGAFFSEGTSEKYLLVLNLEVKSIFNKIL